MSKTPAKPTKKTESDAPKTVHAKSDDHDKRSPESTNDPEERAAEQASRLTMEEQNRVEVLTGRRPQA